MSPKKQIWNHFTQLGIVNGFVKKRVRCNYCSYELSEAAGRCKAHLRNDCLKVQNNVLRQYFGDNFQRNNSNNVSLEPYNVENLFDHLSTIQEPQQDELKLLFAQAVFYCGLPLTFPELEPIKILFKRVYSTFELPTRRRLTGSLLDQIYTDTKTKINQCISNTEFLTLISDG
ncbi:34301_t:CDS:1 [Racocetra persica]|uniref:34301_t:CDS:1 n=1 Tax=Racocetra persica TaxID=160502 RepID=A0ACA9MJ70_9GLOM|nr:34301_t:CDS:1 [Racocetra persica]